MNRPPTIIATRRLFPLFVALLIAAANAFAHNDAGLENQVMPTVKTVGNAFLPNAAFVAQSVPRSMVAGQRYSIAVTLQNTGTTTWTNTTGPGTAGAYSLGTQNPQDNVTWGVAAYPNRVPVQGSVAPGTITTFSFDVIAPATPGTYSFQWQMVDDFVTWFGQRTPNVDVVVSPSTFAPDATFVAQNVPRTMVAGQRYPVSVTLQNAGTTTWTNTTGAGTAGAYSLGTQNPQDNAIWRLAGYPNRVPVNGSVAPGASTTFSFDVVAPDTPGTYSFQWQMVDDYVAWFGENTPNVEVAVSPSSFAPNAEFVGEDVPSSMTAGEHYPVSITLRNSGNTTWTNTTGPGTAGAYSLGTQSPQDNVTWGIAPHPNRVAVDGSVAPGQTATFKFDVIAPAIPGTYPLQWQMVDDYVAWFGARTPNVSVSVGTQIDFVAGPINFDAGPLPYWQAVIADTNADGRPEPFGTINAGAGSLLVRSPAAMGLADLFTSERPYDFRVADLDGDGCEDMVAQGYSAYSPDPNPDSRALLYVNDGSGFFTADPSFADLNLNGRGEGLVIADFNNDSALDLYLPYYTFGLWNASCIPADECPNAPQSYLLLNDGNARFTRGDVPGSVDLRLAPGGQPEGVQAADINDDGRIDLYVSGHVFLNQGTDATGRVSFVDCNCGVYASPYGMLVDEGAKFVDWNNDGLLDLILQDPYAGPKLYQNVGTRTAPLFTLVTTRSDRVTPVFAEKVASADGTSYRALQFCASYGMNVYDLDNDGLEDLVVAGSPSPPSVGCDYPNVVFRNTGNGFESTHAGDVSGIMNGGVYGFGDIDGDGAVDMLYMGASPFYFVNRTAGIGGRSFTIDVRGADGRRTEQGRVVRVRIPNDACAAQTEGCTMTRVVDGGSGYHSQNQYPILVGTRYSGPHTVEVLLPKAGDPTATVMVTASVSPGEYVEILAPSALYPSGRVMHLQGPPAGTCHTP